MSEDVAGNTPIPVPVRSGSARIQKLQIGSIDGDSASVDLKAECLLTIEHPLAGVRHLTRRYGGGVVLRRETDSWRIVTMKQDGVDLASALFEPLPARAAVQDVRIDSAARFTKQELFLLVAVRNLGASVAVLERVFVGGRVWRFFEDGAFLRRRPLVLRTGATWGIAVNLKASPIHRVTTVRVRLDGQDRVLRLHPPKRSLKRRAGTSSRCLRFSRSL